MGFGTWPLGVSVVVGPVHEGVEAGVESGGEVNDLVDYSGDLSHALLVHSVPVMDLGWKVGFRTFTLR